MSFYPKFDAQRLTVGIVEQTIIAPITGRGENPYLLTIENLSTTETFTGAAWSSPNGQNQWTQETDDSFVDILPGKTRRLVLPNDRIWVRVLGNFIGAPDDVRVSAFLLYPVLWTPTRF